MLSRISDGAGMTGGAAALLVLLGTIIVAYTGLRWKRTIRFYAEIRRRSEALKGLPSPKYGFLGITSAVSSRRMHRIVTAWANQYGPIFKARFLAFHVVIVTDPGLARGLLRSKLLDKFRYQYSYLDPFLAGPNLLTGNTNEHWQSVRKGIAPAFSVANMRAASKAINERAYKLVAGLKAHGPGVPVNVDDLLLRESMDIIGRVGFQREMGALEGWQQGKGEGAGTYVQVMLRCTEEVVRRLENPLSTMFGFMGRQTRQGNVIFQRWQELVRGLLKHVQAINGVPGSFADLLLNLKDCKSGRPLSDKQMLPEIAALFFAGIDTTGHTGTWSLYMISQHPKVEAKLVEELDAAGLLATPARPAPRQMEFEDIVRLTYLRCVIKEVLRMFPPVGVGQIRVSHTHDLVLCNGKLTVPRSTLIWVPHHSMHNAAHNWDEPDRFLPERWEDPTAEYAQKPSALPADWQEEPDTLDGSSTGGADRAKRYIPFADGPRNCIGQSLAQTTLPITLGALLSHFSFRLADQMGGPEGVAKREETNLVTGIAGGMYLHAVPRVPSGASAAAPC